MISHELKCIFIHIPRTGGSSIEKALVGKDWWIIDAKTKHLTASQAKKIYAEYWDSYFKFSFVRHPYSRMLSLTSFPNMCNVYYGDRLLKGNVCEKRIKSYQKIFGDPILIEHDYRFYNRKDIQSETHKENCVYGNILDEPIDYVGRFEALEKDFGHICSVLGAQGKKLPTVNKTRNTNTLTMDAKLLINKLYRQDFLTFSYEEEHI